LFKIDENNFFTAWPINDGAAKNLIQINFERKDGGIQVNLNSTDAKQ